MIIIRKQFCKSFLLSFLAFSILAAIIITSLFLNINAVDPLTRESTVLIGVTDNGSLLSLCLINFDPQNKFISFLPIPDNVWLENGEVLQSQYNKRNVNSFSESIENLIGTKINRYIFLSIDQLVALHNQLGQFPMNAKYPFVHNGEMKAGTLHVDGELLKSMFRYNGYDMSKVSISNIAYSYLETFLSTYTKPSHNEKLTEVLTNRTFISDIHTNINKKEMKEYCELLEQFSLMTQKTVQLSGKYDTQPHSSTYFFPSNPKLDKNIFK